METEKENIDSLDRQKSPRFLQPIQKREEESSSEFASRVLRDMARQAKKRREVREQQGDSDGQDS
ncbi:MAG: hypothetical protein HKN23_16150 [Verrucomicrobiales bacterium]|nr:hypothetical protein [Verrucomicrobiales bacterium]